MKATLIIGLPGSGKTFLGKQFVNFIDDPTELPFPSAEEVAIADCNLCNPNVRQRAVDHLTKLGYNVSCVYFENNPDKCFNNVKFRNDGRNVRADILNLSKIYVIPDDVVPLEIDNDFERRNRMA